MKETIKLFNRICRVINPEVFYSIGITDYKELTFQGHFKNETALQFRSARYDNAINDIGYVTFTRTVFGHKIKITLT